MTENHLGEIDQGGFVDGGVQAVIELQGQWRIGIGKFRQRHLAVQVLVRIEIARNRPALGIVGKRKLRPLPDNPNRIRRHIIGIPEAEPIVKHPENDL